MCGVAFLYQFQNWKNIIIKKRMRARHTVKSKYYSFREPTFPLGREHLPNYMSCTLLLRGLSLYPLLPFLLRLRRDAKFDIKISTEINVFQEVNDCLIDKWISQLLLKGWEYGFINKVNMRIWVPILSCLVKTKNMYMESCNSPACVSSWVFSPLSRMPLLLALFLKLCQQVWQDDCAYSLCPAL